MFEREKKESAIAFEVRRAVSENPDFMSVVIDAAVAGQKDALTSARKRIAELDRGYLLALCLVTGSKLTASMRTMMENAMLPILKGGGSMCQAERDAIKAIENREQKEEKA